MDENGVRLLVSEHGITLETLRELLIIESYQSAFARQLLETHLLEPLVVSALIEIAKDDYSDVARSQALYWLWHEAPAEILEKHEAVLLSLQDYELGTISGFANLALSKIRSSEGQTRLRELLEERDGCCGYWMLEDSLKQYEADHELPCPCNRCS